MKIFIPIYVRFLFFISLYFISLENAFCHTTNEGNYLSRIITIFARNKHFIKYVSRTINRPNSINSLIFNVLDHGAKGDGITNDTEAFKTTWDAACKTKEGVMLVPSGFTFLLQPVIFYGSYCQPNIVFQVDGEIVAPNKSDWVTYNVQWILFKEVRKGIIIKGKGIIDGRGVSWWNSDDGSVFRAHAMRIVNSSDVTVTGITIQNSPRMHIFIDKSQAVLIYNFTVSSPGNSPNTDGIHISRVQHVVIHNTTLACGDDCVSIQNGCSDVKIYDVKCGPGHGYSIGGLAPNKEEAHVSGIAVLNSTVNDALTGVRIKTWPSGSGSVRDVVFSGITMSNVKTPIVIDQNYCGGHKICPITDENAVAISNVTYTSIKGTYSYKPVSLACSEFIPCINLTFGAIEITPTPKRAKDPVKPFCSNAYGEVLVQSSIIPSLTDCLLSREAPPPALPPNARPTTTAHEAPTPVMRTFFWL